MIESLKQDENGFIDKDGITWSDQQSFIYISVLGLCGCGNPADVAVWIKTMLMKLKNKEWGDYDDMPYMFFVYWANDKGFAEHGTSARCSWLTKKGEELLSDIGKCIELETAANAT